MHQCPESSGRPAEGGGDFSASAARVLNSAIRTGVLSEESAPLAKPVTRTLPNFATRRAVTPSATPIDNRKWDDILLGRKFAAGEYPFFRRRPMTLRSLQTTCSHMLI
jgi:hypothetical protein